MFFVVQAQTGTKSCEEIQLKKGRVRGQGGFRWCTKPWDGLLPPQSHAHLGLVLHQSITACIHRLGGLKVG